MFRSFLGASAAGAALLGLGLATQSCLAQQAPAQGAAPATGNLSQEGQTFLTKVANGSQLEVELGKLAERNSTNPAVKEFGLWMRCDHSLALQMARQIAGQVGFAIPQQLSPTHRQELQELSRLRGAEFDRAYTRNMVKDHEKDIAMFQVEAQNGQSPAVKNFAAETVWILKWHLRGAQIAAKSVDQSGR